MNRTAIHKTLNTLPKSLDQTYERALLNIREEYQQQAIIAMHWLVYSRRPLELIELADAVSVDFSQSKGIVYDPDGRLFKPELILEICSSLISSTGTDSFANVRLAHFSVQEYLTSKRILDGPAAAFALTQQQADSIIAEFSVSYLLSQNKHKDNEKRDTTPEAKDNAAAFDSLPQEASALKYAVQYWYQHASSLIDHSKELSRGIIDLLTSGSKHFCVDDWWHYACKFRTSVWYEIQDIRYFGGSAGCAAYLCLLPELLSMLNSEADPQWKEAMLESALYAAAYGGHKDLIQALLQQGAPINARGQPYGNAIQAAALGSAEIVSLLLEEHADPNFEGGKYGSALQAAATKGHKDIVQLLLDNGASPEAGTKIGSLGSALQAAAYAVSKDTVELLLTKGADPNAEGGKYATALQAAAYRSSKDIVKTLLEHGADPNIEGGEYGSAIQASAHWADLDIMALLLDHGANPDVCSGRTSYGTPLQAAANWGNLDTAELLLQKGADPNARAGKYGSALDAATHNRDQPMVELLLQYGAKFNVDDVVYSEILKTAASRSNKEVAELLLDPLVNPAADIGCYGKAVQLAALAGYGEAIKPQDNSSDMIQLLSPRHLATLKLHEHLVQIIPRLDEGKKIRYSSAFTPLHWAAWRDHPEVVQEIFEKAVEIEANAQTPNGSPLTNGNTSIVGSLLEGHASLADDWSPLHVAIFRQHANVAKAIIQMDGSFKKLGGHPDLKSTTMKVLEASTQAKPDFTSSSSSNNLLTTTKNLNDSLGWTALHIIALLGHSKLLDHIVETHPTLDIDMPDANGMTALHWLAATGRQEMVELFLSLGADSAAEDTWGRTPADIAAGESRMEILKLLSNNDQDEDQEEEETKTEKTKCMNKTTTDTTILSLGVNCASWRVCDSCDYVFRHEDHFLRNVVPFFPFLFPPFFFPPFPPLFLTIPPLFTPPPHL